jgi:hypothetical protein
MADLLHSLEERYDLILLDAPPLLPVTDAAVLAVETSGAVLVVHHGNTRREQLENSAQSLAAVGARILGTVINFAPRKGPEAYYYGYGYSYRKAEPKPAASRRRSGRSARKSAVISASPSGPTSRNRLNGREIPSEARTNVQTATWPNGPVLPNAADSSPTPIAPTGAEGGQSEDSARQPPLTPYAPRSSGFDDRGTPGHH